MLETMIGLIFVKALSMLGFMVMQYAALNRYNGAERFKSFDNIMFYSFFGMFAAVDVILYYAFSVLGYKHFIISGVGSLLALIILAGNIIWIVCESKKAKQSAIAKKESI